MDYLVTGQDGKEYGPASIDVLRQWAAEGRVTPQTQLRDVQTGQTIMAAGVQGLFDPATTYSQPQQFGQYYRGAPMPGMADTSSDVTMAWVFGAIGLVCCPIIFSILGIYYGNRAVQRGNPAGRAAMIFSIVTLVLGIVFGVIVRMGQLGRF